MYERFLRATTLGMLLAGSVSGAVELTSINGKLLSIEGGYVGSRIALIDGATKLPTTIIANDTLSRYTGGGQADWIGQARFSPDGSRICFVYTWWLPGYTGHGLAILTADNNGRNVSKVCDLNFSVSGSDYIALSWCTDGYIYWSECTDTVWRVNPELKQREAFWTNVGVSGYHADWGPYVEYLTVSRDGRIASGNNGGHVHALDLERKQVLVTCGGGCRGAITTSGDAIVHWLTCCGYRPAGYDEGNSFLSVTAFQSVTDCESYTHMFAPGCATAPVSGNRAWMFRGACNSDDWYVGRGDANLAGSGVLQNRHSSDWMLLPGYAPSDFWLGVMPPPPAATPRIALDSARLNFVSTGATPAPKVVRVSNTGIGTLTNVTVTESATWLTVVRSGSGNSQTLTNSVDVTGLAAGAYNATVSVSGGNAPNTETYTVTLNVGSALAAPTNLQAGPGATAASVALSWQDNTATEAGFVVERRPEGGAWARVTTSAANAVSYVDAALAAGVYNYRVRAFSGADSSAWSNTASVSVAAVVTITVTSPTAGQQLVAGSIAIVRWTAPNSGGVKLEWTSNGGETWSLVPVGGSIRPDTTIWGAYPWTVPSVPSSECMIRVEEYTNNSVYGESAVFTIVSGTGGVAARAAAVGLRQAAPRRLVDLKGRVVVASSRPGDGARLSIMKNCGTFGVVLGK